MDTKDILLKMVAYLAEYYTDVDSDVIKVSEPLHSKQRYSAIVNIFKSSTGLSELYKKDPYRVLFAYAKSGGIGDLNDVIEFSKELWR
jgi:hypothetical protein